MSTTDTIFEPDPTFDFYQGGLLEYVYYLDVLTKKMDDEYFWRIYTRWVEENKFAYTLSSRRTHRTVIYKTMRKTFEVYLDSKYVGVIRSFGGSTDGFSAVRYDDETGYGKGARLHSLEYAITFLVGETAVKDVKINYDKE